MFDKTHFIQVFDLSTEAGKSGLITAYSTGGLTESEATDEVEAIFESLEDEGFDTTLFAGADVTLHDTSSLTTDAKLVLSVIGTEYIESYVITYTDTNGNVYVRPDNIH